MVPAEKVININKIPKAIVDAVFLCSGTIIPTSNTNQKLWNSDLKALKNQLLMMASKLTGSATVQKYPVKLPINRANRILNGRANIHRIQYHAFLCIETSPILHTSKYLKIHVKASVDLG
jgi:hypothetical protein